MQQVQKVRAVNVCEIIGSVKKSRLIASEAVDFMENHLSFLRFSSQGPFKSWSSPDPLVNDFLARCSQPAPQRLYPSLAYYEVPRPNEQWSFYVVFYDEKLHDFVAHRYDGTKEEAWKHSSEEYKRREQEIRDRVFFGE